MLKHFHRHNSKNVEEEKEITQSTSSIIEEECSSITKEENNEVSEDELPSSEQEDNTIGDHSKWQNPDYFQNKWQEYLFIFSCMMSQLLNQAATPQTLSIMNIITDSFKSEGGKETWLIASFPLVSGSFILISGRIGDIYGLKKTLIGGYLFFIIWSLISGFTDYSHNDIFFIISRAFQGLGIAFILPNVMGIVGNIYKPDTQRKNIVISMIGASAPIGAFMGSLFAGLIGTENPKQWPWAFYAFAIASAINLAISIYSIPNNIPTNIHGFAMDWIGSIMAVIGLILLNFVWNQGPIVGWQKAYIIVLLIISIIALVLFFTYEIKYAKSPILPVEVTKNRHIIMILAALFLGWGSFGIFSFYYFSFLLNLRHYSALWAGTTYFMFAIWGTVAAVIVGAFIKRISASVILFFSMIAFNIGLIMLSVTPVDQTYFRMNLGTMIILSFGMDMSFPAAAIILSDGLTMQYQGMAGSLANTMVNYSMSLCLGMGTTVERQINKSGKEILKGYRAAEYLGVGLAGLGIVISGIYMAEVLWAKRKERLSSNRDHDMS
ncbi:borate transporter NDAI_0E00280 [Naumovozyma dairenensis CBS 421]|uniref:Major facilitator superfamily (MFS) profile domain-containing protein n=1 Tax=Naumovozyma dairenensis (strain ATCC 10597 / BCRC 20456 / CBS 421 / NBRC 0211 / NRRL Y-12639) TaxID=1071378 RepID=G0WAS4_NAUDC|nr:hypothetical protein NDAI_0E00280 [Naumovozyma dairenensis CBS 421]CCD24844.1 hypothetical protein NDAI_0E00280 [Naumovozyma dairenensis CBS 421]